MPEAVPETGRPSPAGVSNTHECMSYTRGNATHTHQCVSNTRDDVANTPSCVPNTRRGVCLTCSAGEILICPTPRQKILDRLRGTDNIEAREVPPNVNKLQSCRAFQPEICSAGGEALSLFHFNCSQALR